MQRARPVMRGRGWLGVFTLVLALTMLATAIAAGPRSCPEEPPCTPQDPCPPPDPCGPQASAIERVAAECDPPKGGVPIPDGSCLWRDPEARQAAADALRPHQKAFQAATIAGSHEVAVAHLERVAKDADAAPLARHLAWSRIATAHLRAARTGKAAGALDQSEVFAEMTLRCLRADVSYLRARIAEVSGDVQSRIEYLDTSIAGDPSHTLALVDRLDVYMFALAGAQSVPLITAETEGAGRILSQLAAIPGARRRAVDLLVRFDDLACRNAGCHVVRGILADWAQLPAAALAEVEVATKICRSRRCSVKVARALGALRARVSAPIEGDE